MDANFQNSTASFYATFLEAHSTESSSYPAPHIDVARVHYFIRPRPPPDWAQMSIARAIIGSANNTNDHYPSGGDSPPSATGSSTRGNTEEGRPPLDGQHPHCLLMSSDVSRGLSSDGTRKRYPLACYACHKNKNRCGPPLKGPDGAVGCHQCQDRGLICEYPAARRHRGKGKSVRKGIARAKSAPCLTTSVHLPVADNAVTVPSEDAFSPFIDPALIFLDNV